MSRWDSTPPGVKASLVIATGFGLGLSPVASGTVGTLPALPLVWALSGLAWPWQLAVLGLPLCQAPLMLPVAFVVARVCDIVKPWPARGLQSLEGGYGIVIDDVFASLYALAINWLFYLYAYPQVSEWVARFWPF
jgi:phosphatidylglycerophosphatase A